MSKVIPFLPKAKAKAELGKVLAKGKTKAKDAKAPPSKLKQAKKIKEAAKRELKMSNPGHLARCRAIVGCHWPATALLYRIAGLCQPLSRRSSRIGRPSTGAPLPGR